MDRVDLAKRIAAQFEHVVQKQTYGESTFFFNQNLELPNGAYFATIKENDGPNDKSSRLNRAGVFRLSFKPYPISYQKIFGAKPVRPAKGQTIGLGFDFSKIDELLPHPVYAWMGWVMVLSPTEKTLDAVWCLLQESYAQARLKFASRK